LVVVERHAERAAIEATAARLAGAALPDIPADHIRAIAAVSAVAAPPPASASVGPFDVAPSSRRPLIATLVVAFVAILALAAWTAWRERWRVRYGGGHEPS
jgi:hypothetical protein